MQIEQIFNREKYENLHELFVAKLQALYDTEQRITQSLPEMIDSASNPLLKKALEDHLAETRNQIARIEKALASVGARVERGTAEGIRGIITEGEHLIGRMNSKEVSDAGIIAAAQEVEHYEIANYGTVAEWADTMGHMEASRLLKETLAEEEAADERLSDLAESQVNAEANTMAMGR